MLGGVASESIAGLAFEHPVVVHQDLGLERTVVALLRTHIIDFAILKYGNSVVISYLLIF